MGIALVRSDPGSIEPNPDGHTSSETFNLPVTLNYVHERLARFGLGGELGLI